MPATDKAQPVLVSAQWADGSSAGGVDAGDYIYLTFSEPVTSSGAVAGDFGRPVTNDAYGTGAAVADSASSNTVTLTLGSSPYLTPGGVYSPGILTPTSPSGIFVDNGAHIVDGAGNTALVQTIDTAKDIGPGTELVSICWADDFSVTPKVWNVGTVDAAGTYDSDTAAAFVPSGGLAVRNNGTVVEKITVSCSSSSPSNWTLGSSAGANRFGMLVNNRTISQDLSTGSKQIAGQIYSGHNQGFNLHLALPTSVTDINVEQTITVTITAVKD